MFLHWLPVLPMSPSIFKKSLRFIVFFRGWEIRTGLAKEGYSLFPIPYSLFPIPCL